MTDLVIYLLKVILIQAVCLGLYKSVLSNTKFHQWNRWFLLSSLLLAFVIPSIELPAMDSEPIVVPDSVHLLLTSPEQTFSLVPIAQRDGGHLFDVRLLFQLCYILVVGWLLGRSIIFLVFIQKLKSQSQYVKNSWFKLYKTSRTQAFSFFKNVFIPKSLFGKTAFDQVLEHECEHVRQLHSMDRLLLDLMISLFWFNPFIYWYRNALIQIHEYQADEAAIRQSGDPVTYQETLFTQLQLSGHRALVSHFNFSMIKKRIVMINKHNNKSERWKYLLVLPLLALITFSFSYKDVVTPLERAGNHISNMVGPFPELDMTLFNSPKFVRDQQPSILPLKVTKEFRISSGFGRRTDPFTQEQKMHQGMDFAAPLGTDVLASADGNVVYTRNHPNGYGQHILIQHGEKYQTKYAQLSEMLVGEGDEVSKGDIIGKVGSSGRSTAPHLHYEVIEIGKGHLDPADFIHDYSYGVVRKADENERIPSVYPVDLAQLQRMGSGFGYRTDPILKIRRLHSGIDFSLKTGTPVFSTASGEVAFVSESFAGYGKQIKVNHGNGIVTRYAHLSEVMVKVGDKVTIGQQIAKSGNSGKSTAPHLHYEVIKDGQPVDPVGYFPHEKSNDDHVSKRELKPVLDSTD